jgi:alpha-beta hydrolase superfamily lysophospholipase
MRLLLAALLILAAGACNAQPAPSNEASVAAADSEAVRLKAADGVTVFGRRYNAEKPRALILLFHQAGSSKDEYATIAPRLVTAGYSALAIDQRAGGGLYGMNETANALGHDADYLDARPDLQAALDWARTQHLPIILWGSSYSSSLIFPLAADHPQGIIGLLSFSPGEYFDSDKHLIATAAAKVRVPVFIASTRAELSDADPIMAALPRNAANVRFVPDHGVHGSSTLIAAKNPAGAEANWRAVRAFLNRIAPAK